MRAECPYVRTVELAQCCSGFKRKAVLRESVQENIFFRRSLDGGFTVSHFSQNPREMGHPVLSSPSFPGLLADAEFPDDGFVTLGIVSLEVVEQATPLADQHEQAAARAVVLLVRFEVVRQLANAFTNDGDLNLGTPRVSRVRLILVNDRFLLLSG
jgi:hypothetical protein